MVLMRTPRAALVVALVTSVLPLAPSAVRADDLAGVVRMTRAEYDRLKDDADAAKLAGPRRKPAEAAPSVLSASYAVAVDAVRAALDVTAEVDVPSADGRAVLSGLGLLDALSDSGPSPVLAFPEEGAGGRLVLHFEKPGRYRVTLRSILPERAERDRRVVEFTALAAASARLTASSSVPGAELSLSAGAGSPTEVLAPNAARPVPASALVRLDVRTPGRVPVVPEKPVVIVETLDVLRPERERLAHRILLRLGVSRGELSAVTTSVPPGSELVASSVPDDAVAALDREKGLLTLTSPRPFRSTETISFLLSRPLPGADEPVEASPARVAEASASRAWLLVSPTAAREHVPGTVGGMARIDTADLPPIVRPFVEGGTRAYRVAAPDGAKLVFRAPLRQVEAPPEAVLFEASLLTVLSPTSARVDRHRYVVETRKPSWSLPLLPDEEVLSVLVDGAPVRPLSGEGTLVVLLPPSREAVRTVEVTKRRKAETVPESGEMSVLQPALPSQAGLVTWTLVLPEERRYRVVGSAGLGKAGWSRDAPAVAMRFQPGADGYLDQPAQAGWLAVRVTDQSGQPLPGVSISVRSEGGGTRTGVTTAAGEASFGGLPPGRYDVTGTLSGFNSVTRRVSLGADSGRQVGLRLPLSTVNEMVTVTAESPTVDTKRSSIGQSFSTDQRYPAGEIRLGKRKDRQTEVAEPMRVGAPEKEEDAVDGGVAGGVEGGVPGGVVGGAVSGTKSDDLSMAPQSNVAGVRSLPMRIEGRGKRLTLFGPVAGGTPVSVTLKVKKG